MRYKAFLWFGALLSVALVATAAGLHSEADSSIRPAPTPKNGQEVATFAGGCFWCMEHAFDPVKGVISTTSGYTGGTLENPTYEDVSSGRTGHFEALQVVYDPRKVTYEELLDVFWHNIDPSTADRQFCDRGSQYRSAIFYHNPQQKTLAEASKARLERSTSFASGILTEILPLTRFYPAETYHQDFYKKNPIRYESYRRACQRDATLQRLWGTSK